MFIVYSSSWNSKTCTRNLTSTAYNKLFTKNYKQSYVRRRICDLLDEPGPMTSRKNSGEAMGLQLG